jgi:hypothetical protein
MFYVADECPICRTGPIGFFRLSDGESVVLMCEECTSVWLSPQEIGSDAIYPWEPDYLVPAMGAGLLGDRVGWATREEIAKRGWSDSITGYYATESFKDSSSNTG